MGTVLLAENIDPIFIDILGLLLIAVCAAEVAKALKNRFPAPHLFAVYIIAGVSYAGKLICGFLLPQAALSVYFGGVMLGSLVLLIMMLAAKDKEKAGRINSTLFLLVYPVTLLSFTFAFGSLASVHRHAFALGLTFLVTSGSDMFALLFGVTIKGPKLAPKISPNKTIAGAIGGIVGGITGAMLMYLITIFHEYLVIFPNFAPLVENSIGLNIMHFIIIGVVGSIMTQAGDLFASYLKRKCEIKDYGHVLPGHGGILDRMDGYMFNSIFVFFYIALLFTFV